MRMKYLVFYSEWCSPGWYDTVKEFELESSDPKAILEKLKEVVPCYMIRKVDIREISSSWTGEELMNLAGLKLNDEYKFVEVTKSVETA